jgi:hypothetical protein
MLLFMLPAASRSQTKLKSPPAIPFSVGETLVYDGKLSKIISGISIAELKFTLDRASDGTDYTVVTEARNKGTLLKLFRFSFLQRYETTIDGGERFRAIRTKKHDVQKERIRDSEALFNYDEKRVTFIETDPKEPMRPPRKIASEIDTGAQDLISGIYLLRTLPLAVGKTFEMTVSDSGLVYQIPVKVTGRELQKTVVGRVWCFRVEPDVFGPGRIIEKEGSMVIWITDTPRRLPVRSLINTSIGKIEIKLKSATKQ